VIGLRVQLSERHTQLHTVAQEWSQAKVLLSARETLISKLEAHINGLGSKQGSTAAQSEDILLSSGPDQPAPASNAVLDVSLLPDCSVWLVT
jgi:hypothetical protein